MAATREPTQGSTRIHSSCSFALPNSATHTFYSKIKPFHATCLRDIRLHGALEFTWGSEFEEEKHRVRHVTLAFCHTNIWDKEKKTRTEERWEKLITWLQLTPLHRNLQVEKFQRCGRVFHQCQARVKLQLALRLLLLTILQPYHLPPPLPSPVSNSSCLFPWCQPLDASCCTGLLYFSRYCTVRLKVFSLFLGCLSFMYYLCEKCYKPITVQYYIADCVSWVPRLTLLDLRTNWTYECALGTEFVCM